MCFCIKISNASTFMINSPFIVFSKKLQRNYTCHFHSIQIHTDHSFTLSWIAYHIYIYKLTFVTFQSFSCMQIFWLYVYIFLNCVSGHIWLIHMCIKLLITAIKLIFCPALLFPEESFPVLSCPVLSYHVLFCSVLCHIIPNSI